MSTHPNHPAELPTDFTHKKLNFETSRVYHGQTQIYQGYRHEKFRALPDGLGS